MTQLIKRRTTYLKDGLGEVRSPTLNVIEGTNVTATLVDNETDNRADLTINAVAGFSYDEIDDSVTVTLPVFQQMLLAQQIEIRGTLTLEGTLIPGVFI